MKTSRLMLSILLLLTVSPQFGFGSDAPPKKDLTSFYKTVRQTAEKYYPKSTSHHFRNQLHFEYATRLYTESAIVKPFEAAEVPLEEVRGPQSGGVWCRIELRKGDTPYARSEGRTHRRAFDEYIFYPYSRKRNQHLYVILRLPENDGQTQQKAFLKELKQLLDDFAD